jgi:ABC-type branched-subunit amino acid transport system ATPase component
MALATRPQLLLDEPMAGTGPEESARMVELIEHLARHVTILLSSMTLPSSAWPIVSRSWSTAS